MGKGVKSFLLALLLSIISFLIIFLFIPDTANRYLGVSYKEYREDVRGAIEKFSDDTKEKTKEVITQTVVDKIPSIQDLIK